MTTTKSRLTLTRSRLDELREEWVTERPELANPRAVLEAHGITTDPDKLSALDENLEPWPVAAAAILHLDYVDRCCEASGMSMGYLPFAESNGCLDRWLETITGQLV